MTTNKPTKSQRVSVSKRKLAATAHEIEQVASAAAIAGEKEALHGAELLEEAEALAAAGAVSLAQGASDLTRAQDEQLMSERMAVLSDVVGVAGVVDIAEGAEMLAASEDVGVLSALVGLMSVDDLEHGLELARLSGELHTARRLVESLKMPVFAAFLAGRATRLHEMSVEQIRVAIATKGVSQLMADTGKQIGSLGENEMEEGIARLKVSEAAAGESAALSKASENLAQQGFEEVVLAGEATRAARAETMEGAAEIATGSAVLGAAVAMDDVATTIKKKSE
jgi:hypothetical protein